MKEIEESNVKIAKIVINLSRGEPLLLPTDLFIKIVEEIEKLKKKLKK